MLKSHDPQCFTKHLRYSSGTLPASSVVLFGNAKSESYTMNHTYCFPSRDNGTIKTCTTKEAENV